MEKLLNVRLRNNIGKLPNKTMEKHIKLAKIIKNDIMSTVMDAPANKLIEKTADELKKMENIKPHKLAGFVKTGVCTERPPIQADFWYLRSAALLRKIYLNGPVGVQRLRTAFGKRKRMGHKPPHHRPAGGKFIRQMLQQLEKEGFIKKVEAPKRGRIITPKGQKFLDNLSKEVIITAV